MACFLLSAVVFSVIFFEQFLRVVSNILGPDQAQFFAGPDLGPSYLQRPSAEDTRIVHKIAKIRSDATECMVNTIKLQTVWIQIRANILSGFIWICPDSIDYQQTLNQHEPSILFVDKGKPCRPRSDWAKMWGLILQCQTVLMQIRFGILLGLIWDHASCFQRS